MAVGRSSAAALDKVTYLLPAPAVLPATGPWLIALQKGYYAAEGLDVSFEVAKGGVDVAKQIGAGNAIIGGAIGDTPIIVRSNGVPVKAVALLGGGSLMQLVVHEDSGINGPQGQDDCRHGLSGHDVLCAARHAGECRLDQE
jgi:NitT/TauT family transport system substrate-binding protein